MPSTINADLPSAGNALTADVRENFRRARNEIDALQGAIGVPGATGATGASGPSGPSGAVGATGPSGAVGATGASGTGGGGGYDVVFLGGTAPTGDRAANGCLWYNTNASALMLRVAGVWEQLI